MGMDAPLKRFSAKVIFDNHNDAVDAANALDEAGFNADVLHDDVVCGFSSMYMDVTLLTRGSDDDLLDQILRIVEPFGGLVLESGFEASLTGPVTCRLISEWDWTKEN